MSSAQLQPGDVVGGRYRLIDALGTSSAADTYLAFDVSLNREVDLHVLPSIRALDPAFLQRFRAEAQRVAGLNHPHLVRVYDSGEEVVGAYLVTEHPSGGTLRAVLSARGPLSERAAARLGAEIADGLAYAHDRGMVHGAVSPDTIYFDDEGRAKLADLGLASALSGPQAGAATDVRYASPEQAQSLPADGATDVYALALSLFEAITTRPPFLGSTPADTLRLRIGAALPKDPAIGTLDMVLALAAAPDASVRPSAEQFAQRLQTAALTAPDAVTAVLHATPAPRTQAGFAAPSADHVLSSTPTGPARTLSEGVAQQRTTPVGGTPVVSAEGGNAVEPTTTMYRPRQRRRASRRRRLATTVTILLVLLGGTGVGVAWKLGYFSKSSPVPSLVGLSQQQAMTLLTPGGLSLRVTGSETSASIAAGSILSQTPVAGTTLQQGSVVSVVVSGGQVLVPLPSNITGVDCATATSELVSIGISANCPVTLEETSTTFAKGHVIAVIYDGKRNPAQVPGGATVDLIVSLGAHAPGSTTTLPGTTTTQPVTTTTVNPHGPRAVPNLVGLSRSATFAAMKSAEFYFATHGPGSATGTWTKVVAQSPAPGTMLRWHGTVTLQVK